MRNIASSSTRLALLATLIVAASASHQANAMESRLWRCIVQLPSGDIDKGVIKAGENEGEAESRCGPVAELLGGILLGVEPFTPLRS